MGGAAVPAAAPVAVEELKAYLRIATSEEDALIAGAIRTATALCESFTRLALIEREVTEVLAAAGGWTRLGQAPVRAILEVARLSPEGAESVLPPEDHAIDIDAAGIGWVRAAGAERVRVRYVAGQAADWNGIPEPLRHGIVRLAAHLHMARDAATEAAPPAAVTALWRPWRRLALA